MEPIPAPAATLLDPAFVDRKAVLKRPIGGTSQLFRIYPYLKILGIGVHWPNAVSADDAIPISTAASDDG